MSPAEMIPGEKILGVAIDTPLRRIFDYRVPAGEYGAPPGGRVWVPFGRRRVAGIVIEQRDRSEIPFARLRSIHASIDTEPIFDPPLLKLLQWSADYYHHPVGEVLAAALPARLRAGAPLHEALQVWRLTESGRRQAMARLPTRAIRLRGIIEYLTPLKDAATAEILEAAGASMEALRRVVAHGFVESCRRVPASAAVGLGINTGPSLNDAQQAAVERIGASLAGFTSWLLHGVTGSGKTEVYMHAIAACLARARQALILVPEIALTPQLIRRFRERFSLPMAVLHSGLSDSSRLGAWRLARQGQARIVIGTRSAVFAPLPQLGLIILDEEHDPSFKQQDGFRYSARDLAIVRAQRLGIPIVLGSATPSLETFARARRDPDTLLRLPRRATGAKPPRLSLVDLRNQPQTQGLATATVQAISRHLKAGGQAMLYLNRRGYAPVMYCPGCNWTAHCRRCDAHLTVHGHGTRLLCHHCGHRQVVASLCPQCSRMLKPVGQGTERIEETLSLMFPGVPLARIDRDSIRRKGELEAVLRRVANNEVRLLVGTQMLTKGHDFPNVTLVVVLNADQGLFSTDFRASERLAQTIVQVAGRAGRAARLGEVLIQTECPEHPLLRTLLSGGYEAFAESALQERQRSGWPPFARIALLRAEATAPTLALQFLQAALVAARACRVSIDEPSPSTERAKGGNAGGGLTLLGPAPAPMERRAGRFRAQLLLQAATHGPLQKFLSAWLPTLDSLPESRQVRWSIDVDAQELL